MTPITAGLQRDIDKYQVYCKWWWCWRLSNFPSLLCQAMLPLLKYVKGEVLSPEHWHEMFLLLGFPRGTTLEKLSFGDILSHSEEIVANADKLKELYR